MRTSLDDLHPGPRIKDGIIPKGMSVTAAARLMGVGRVALSNLLNGKAALSPEMATRLEKAFKCRRDDLLQMQAAYEAAQAQGKAVAAETKAYIPPFLRITANDIVQWVTHNHRARSRLSVFLRTLVHSTGRGITKVDFPGNDDAQRPGWDGLVEASEGTPWLPAGRSGWEFGVNEDVKTKADSDLKKSEERLTKDERDETTFVFVTPRRWPGKGAWLERVKRTKRWKDVRAYDASDLEQWLEQSLPAQTWFASENKLPADGVRSLDKCWHDWANVSHPPLTGALFGSAMESARRMLRSRLEGPSGAPTVIAADSTDEALAFLSQLFGDGADEKLATCRDRILVFDTAGVLPRLAEGAATFIAVAHTREVERELGPYIRSIPSIVVYPRNVANTRPDLVLEPANYDTFDKALQQMGKKRDEISQLTKESGRSLTVLRRRLATVPAVQTPEWAADSGTAASLVPFLLVGSWHSENASDTATLSRLAGDRSYDELERECQKLTQLNDAPTWSIGAYRGVISKLDLLYAIRAAITPQDLRRYFSIAREVLGEDDPALDLEEGQRWAAAFRGKTRQFSGVLRESISETLVLLAVHGPSLFKQRLGVDTEAEAARVVRDLLHTPLTLRVLEAHHRDLPTYAEAAPDEFLSILEDDLKSEQPAALGLLRPAAGIFGHPTRTGLLWALEALSWNPKTLVRSAPILARLAQIEIKDNWGNKPFSSLNSIFCSWMPQTAASRDERVALLTELAEGVPDVAWKICLSQFGRDYGFGESSYKPRWRSDGYGFGEPLGADEVRAFARSMIEMALSWKAHTLSTLSDLVERIHRLDPETQARVWPLIEQWSRDEANDEERATMREKIRVFALSRRAVTRASRRGSLSDPSAMARTILASLEPQDLLNKHAWLFQPWVEPSAEDVEDEAFDYDKHFARTDEMRIEAMREVLAERGLPGLLALAKNAQASQQIGFLAANGLLSAEEIRELLRLAFREVLQNADGLQAFKALIGGAIVATSEGDRREHLLKSVATKLRDEDTARLLVLAPFTTSTWRLVDALGDAGQDTYWRDATPERINNSDAEYNEGVERLLKARRPRAAFSYVRFKFSKLDAQLLRRLLTEVAKGEGDEAGKYLLEEHDIQSAFEHLNKSPLVTVEDKAVLELAFLDALGGRGLDDNGARIPNLQRYVESHPDLYVAAIAWAYRRSDGGADPPEVAVPPERRQGMAERGHKLLNALVRIPGCDGPSELKAGALAAWVASVRGSGAALGRTEISDHCLGNLLAHARAGEDGVWPCESVREVMENVRSVSMMSGARNGRYNLRGMHARGEGGEQERALAAQYRKWGEALRFTHPYVSSHLLMELARTYEDEGSREDTEAGIRRRLR